MSVSVVNGCVCEGSCDVAKAKRGEDPHPATNAFKTGESGTDASGVSPLDGPAVVFGGALAQLSAAAAVTPVGASRAPNAASTNTPGRTLDILA